MKALIKTSFVIGALLTLQSNQSVNAAILEPIAPQATQENILLARGGGGGHGGDMHHADNYQAGDHHENVAHDDWNGYRGGWNGGAVGVGVNVYGNPMGSNCYINNNGVTVCN